MAKDLTSPALTNRERKRRERAAAKARRAHERVEDERLRHIAARDRHPYKHRGDRWTPVPETDGSYEVNQRGQIRRTPKVQP